MPQTNRLHVEVLPAGEAGAEHGKVPFEDVHYVSFVNEESFGIPAIISDERYKGLGLPLRVLYVNPGNVAAMEVTRTA